jgi:hypothetical protein
MHLFNNTLPPPSGQRANSTKLSSTFPHVLQFSYLNCVFTMILPKTWTAS